MRYRIATKIFTLAVTLLALTVALTAFGTWMTRKLGQVVVRIADNYIPLHDVLDEVDTFSFKRQLAFEQRLALMNQPAPDERDLDFATSSFQDHDAHVTATINRADELLTAILRDTPDAAEMVKLRALLQEVKRESDMLARLQERILDAGNMKNKAVENELRPLHRDLLDTLEHRRTDMEELIGRLTENASLDAKNREARLVWITAAATLVAVVFGLLWAWLMTRRMVHPVETLMSGIQSVEKGDLSIEVPVRSSDEIGVLTTSFNRLVSELRAKERMKETFGKYIDPRIVEKVILNPSSADPEGGKRVMTISFCDLVGFTNLGENLSPTGLVRLLNRHFELVADAIHAYQGVLDKFIGDAAMAFWGPPFSATGDHAAQACRSALAQIRVMETLRLELPELTGMRRNIPVVDLRVGLASGDVVVGNIGADKARTYTVIGDTVNLASRLESVNRVYDTRILISGETRSLAGDLIEVREIDWIAVKGKSERATAYELMGIRGEVVKERLAVRDRYEEGLQFYRTRNWSAAETSFRGVLELAPSDGPSQEMLKRIAGLQSSPPAGDWDGVWHPAEK
ncbi:MAG TPA: adenylate/guanylate cyclase domain-containing protein [Bryobacteraceae bacterium]|nr:adenylate/guanylate cyclase domain-containing protein [Bryobacteraceae bacterium]